MKMVKVFLFLLYILSIVKSREVTGSDISLDEMLDPREENKEPDKNLTTSQIIKDLSDHIMDRSNSKEKNNYSSGRNEIRNRRSLKVIGKIAEVGLDLLNVAFGIEDVLTKCGIFKSDESEKVLTAISKNYAAIGAVGEKVDRNFEAIKDILLLSSTTLSSIEKTRFEMHRGFKLVLESIKELKVGDTISSLTTFMNDFSRRKDKVTGLSGKTRVTELERSGGILDQLKNAIASDGILHGNLYHILNQRLAIPKNAQDELAFATLHVLYYGVQTYVSAMFFVVDQYSYLADYYYQQSDTDKCNDNLDLLQLCNDDFKESLVSDNNEKYLIDKVIDLLREVQNLNFIRSERLDIFQTLQYRQDSLHLIRDKLQHFSIPLILDQLVIIRRKPDFDASKVQTPFGKWKDGAKVSYAIQYKDNNSYSKIGEWSDSFIVNGKACPVLRKIPIDPRRRTRLILRKFGDNQPELVGVIQDKYQQEFEDINRDFFDAASNSNEDIARGEGKILIENGADANGIFENGRRPIHAAAQSGNCKFASELLLTDNKTDINVKDSDGCTAIYLAAEAGYEDFVQLLITKGADVNARANSDNSTPLHISAYKGDVSTVEVLKQSNESDMNAESSSGFTPLHMAIFGGPNVFQVLSSSNKTDINAKSKEGLTPLHLASINNFEDMVEVLVNNNKTDINAAANGGLTALHLASSLGNIRVVQSLLAKNKTDVNARSTNGWTSLHLACFLKREDVALELLKSKTVDVNLKGKNDITPLHVVAVTGQVKVATQLFKNGAVIEEKTQDGSTALHLAAVHSQTKLVSILLGTGANINAKTVNGSTPLSLAASFGNRETVSILLDNKADVKSRNDNGQTAIHEAVLHGKIESLRLLVGRDPGLINLNNQDGESLLHLAAKRGYLDIIRYVVEDKNSYIKVRNKIRDTPLHYASKYGHLDIVQYFLDENCDAFFSHNGFVENKLRKTPLHYALEAGHLDIVKYLIDYKKIDDFPKTLDGAIASGNFGLVKYLVEERNYPIDIRCPVATAFRGKLNIIQYLIEKKKASVEHKFRCGCNMLDLASISGDLEEVKYLVDVKNTSVCTKIDNSCFTPLFLAAMSGSLDLVKYYIDEKKMDLNVQTFFRSTILQVEISPVDISPLSGNLDLVKYLIDEKKQSFSFNSKSKPFIHPVYLASSSGSLSLVKYLIEEKKLGVPQIVELKFDSSDLVKYFIEKKIVFSSEKCKLPGRYIRSGFNFQMSHIMGWIYPDGARRYFNCAIVYGKLDLIKYLDKQEIKKYNPSSDKFALRIATQYGHLDLLKYFMIENHKVKIVVEDNLLEDAVEYGHTEIVRFLVEEEKLDVNFQRSKPDTPLINVEFEKSDFETVLIKASRWGFSDIVKYLLEKGADVDFTGGYKRNALHAAAGSCHLDVVEILVKKGAYVNARCKDGETPLNYAKNSGCQSVMKYLISKAAVM